MGSSGSGDGGKLFPDGTVRVCAANPNHTEDNRVPTLVPGGSSSFTSPNTTSKADQSGSASAFAKNRHVYTKLALQAIDARGVGGASLAEIVQWIKLHEPAMTKRNHWKACVGFNLFWHFLMLLY
jgi:hypothetical protein